MFRFRARVWVRVGLGLGFGLWLGLGFVFRVGLGFACVGSEDSWSCSVSASPDSTLCFTLLATSRSC